MTYFVAPDDEIAALAVEGGPDKGLPHAEFGNFDAYDAMIEWLSVFTGRDYDDLDASDAPRFVVESDDEPVVFVAQPALQQALSSAEPSRLAVVAQRWSEATAEDGREVDVEVAGELLAEVAELAREAASRSHFLYCWMA